jgi:hypothetical protein
MVRAVNRIEVHPYVRQTDVRKNYAALFLEQFLRKVVQAVAHERGVVAIDVHAPDVRHALFRQLVVHPLAEAEEVVVVAH